MIEFDTSEVDKLAADLGKIPGKAVPVLVTAVTKSSRAIRDAMRSEAGGHAHLPHFPSSITDEVKVKVGQIEGVVGPELSLPQGPLGGVVYEGTSKSGPVADLHGPLDRETPKFQKAVEDAAGKLLDG